MQEKTPSNLINKKKHKIKSFKGLKGQLLSRYSCGMKLLKNKYLKFKQFMTARLIITRAFNTRKVFNTKNLKLIRSRLKTDPNYHGSINRFIKYSDYYTEEQEQKITKKGIIFLRSTIDKPLTKKPIQVRMGKGKGAIQSYIYPAKRHRIFIEMTRRKNDINNTKTLAMRAGKKVSPFSKFIFQKKENRKEFNTFRLVYKYSPIIFFKGFLSPLAIKSQKVETLDIHAIGLLLDPLIDKLCAKTNIKDFEEDARRLSFILYENERKN